MDLPPIAVGTRPAQTCPRCEGDAEPVDGDARVEGWGSVRYTCHAQYALALPTLDFWRAERACRTPAPRAVLDALRELAGGDQPVCDAIAVALDVLAERRS
jgi:hypothetical protein